MLVPGQVTAAKKLLQGCDPIPEPWSAVGSGTQLHLLLLSSCVPSQLPGGGRLCYSTNETRADSLAYFAHVAFLLTSLTKQGS